MATRSETPALTKISYGCSSTIVPHFPGECCLTASPLPRFLKSLRFCPARRPGRCGNSDGLIRPGRGSPQRVPSAAHGGCAGGSALARHVALEQEVGDACRTEA